MFSGFAGFTSSARLNDNTAVAYWSEFALASPMW